MNPLFLLLLFAHVRVAFAQIEPAPYPVIDCNPGDGTYNINSFKRTTQFIGGGWCFPGAVLNFPYSVSSLTGDLSYNPRNIIFPNISCYRFVDFYPGGHSSPNNYTLGWKPSIITSQSEEKWTIFQQSDNRFFDSIYTISQYGSIDWKLYSTHVLKGFRCTFSCPRPESQTLVTNGTYDQVYSDGSQRTCHPSNINRNTGMCFNSTTTPAAVNAPYCISPGSCKFDIYTFMSINRCSINTSIDISISSIRQTVILQPGESCVISRPGQPWNIAWDNIAQDGPDTIITCPLNLNYVMDLGSPPWPPSMWDISPIIIHDSFGNPRPPFVSCHKGFSGPSCLPCGPVTNIFKGCNSLTGNYDIDINPCLDRTTNYGLTFAQDTSSSTGSCKQTVPISSSNTIRIVWTDPTPYSTVSSVTIGTAIIQNWGSWLDTPYVTYVDRIETMTFIPNTATVIDASKTFCNGRGQLYGSFKFTYTRFFTNIDRTFVLVTFMSSYSTNPCECYSGYYGTQCQYTCSIPYNIIDNRLCDPVTGEVRCATGTLLVANGTCTQVHDTCPGNLKWGPNCDQECPFCASQYPRTRCDKLTGQCRCPDPDYAVNKNGTVCTLYHCGLNERANCSGISRGVCQDFTDGSGGATCFCKPGYHGRFCELTNKPYNSTSGGMTYEDRDCDCGVVWPEQAVTLDQLTVRNISISVIGIVSWPTQYRDHYVNENILDYSLLDTNSWTVPIIWNRIMKFEDAKQWCYEYRPCSGFMTTPYSANSNYLYVTPFQNNTQTFTNNTLLYANLWYGTSDTKVTSGAQVSVNFIQRSLGYDCSTTELDIPWYFKNNYHEIMYDYGLRFCDLSHRQDQTDPSSNCCINNGVGNNRYCDYPVDHGAIPVPDYENGPFVQWTRRHYDEIGHRKRYAPNQYCDLWPTLYEESSLCAVEKDGCKRPFAGALPCSGRGRCRPNSANLTATNRPYKCFCSKFDPSLTSDLYYSDESSKLNNKNTQGRRKYIGYACEADLNNCIRDVSDGTKQAVCNTEIARCVGLTYPSNSTFANPGTITPHCDCNLIKPSEQLFQESVNSGTYCEKSRCGTDGLGCNTNSSAASCIVDPGNGLNVCQCAVEGRVGDLWIGPSCQIPADPCRPPKADDSGLFKLCGGPGFGVCKEAGSGISTTPNWNATYPWCDCTANANYTGLHCSLPKCASSIVEPYHGYCEGALQDSAVCYPMWDGPDVQCTINKCAGVDKGGGVPTDSGIVGSSPQDICKCTSIGREARKATGGKRPGFTSDPLKAPTSIVGYCFPKCPTTNDNAFPLQYCGGGGYCLDPVHNTNDSIAQCICSIGYSNSTFVHPQWNTTQNTCVPYCSNGGHVDMTADEWGAYLRNPFTSIQPTCVCPNDANGYYNDPDFPSHKTCIDKRCGPDGIWTPDTRGDGGKCECGPSRKLYYPLYDSRSGCKVSRCNGTLPDGTPANRGVVALDGSTCSCFAPFSWGTTQRIDCNSDYCHPNGNLFTKSVFSKTLNDFMLVPDTTKTGVDLCSCTGPFRTSGCTLVLGAYCNQYCTDSSCPNGGTPINGNKNNCSCPAPYVSPRCQTPCPPIISVVDTSIGKCNCLYGWSDGTSGYCSVDPCNAGCPTPDRLCGTFNKTKLSCDCYDGWELQGLSCNVLNTTKATAFCNAPHGSPTGPDSCLCGLLWTGSNCTTSECVAIGSNITFDESLGREVCVCPDGYTGFLCDTILLPPPTPPPSVVVTAAAPLLSTTGIVITSTSGLIILGFVSKYGLYPLYQRYFVKVATSSIFAKTNFHRYSHIK